MADKTINIPHGMENLHMKIVDSISFKVTADCNFCYSEDPTNFFPIMPAGSYTATTPPTVYGPFTPTRPGKVDYNAVTSGTCSPTGGPTATACSITVDS